MWAIELKTWIPRLPMGKWQSTTGAIEKNRHSLVKE